MRKFLELVLDGADLLGGLRGCFLSLGTNVNANKVCRMCNNIRTSLIVRTYSISLWSCSMPSCIVRIVSGQAKNEQI